MLTQQRGTSGWTNVGDAMTDLAAQVDATLASLQVSNPGAILYGYLGILLKDNLVVPPNNIGGNVVAVFGMP